MGLVQKIFGNTELEIAVRERDYYKALYEDKLKDFDVMRTTIAAQRDQIAALESAVAGYMRELNLRLAATEENHECDVVPDKELLF